jgi:glycosyltransferase involved in cell wall biosynthesis
MVCFITIVHACQNDFAQSFYKTHLIVIVTMRILLIAATPFVIEKGSSLRVEFMVRTLAEAGHQVDVVCYPLGKDIQCKGVTIHRVKGKASAKAGPSVQKPVLDWRLYHAAKRLIAINHYDAIQGEDTEGGFIACLLGKKYKMPVVYDMHNKLTEQLRLHKWYPLLPFASVIERTLLTTPKLILANWKRVEAQVKEKNPKMKTLLVYDAVSLEEKKPKVKLPANYIVYTGSFASYQGVELLIQAHRLSGAAVPLVLVGEPSVAAQRLAHQGIIFTGRLPVAETNYIIKRALFCVIPRVHGKQPSMKIIHYALFKKAILATDIPCNHELLKEYRCALFVQPDVDALARGVKKLAREKKTRNALEKAAGRLARTVHPEEGKKKLIAAYAALTKGSDKCISQRQ